MNDAFSSHTYQLLYHCRDSFSSPTTFDERYKIDWGFKIGFGGGRGGEPGGPRPSRVVLATPKTRGRGSKGRSYFSLNSFDPYRTPVFYGRLTVIRKTRMNSPVEEQGPRPLPSVCRIF